MSILVLKSKCSWSNCIFCGYSKRGPDISTEELKNQFDTFFENVDDDGVKVFGSGSFLDEKQVPSVMRGYFIKKCLGEGVRTITIESRPEFVTKEKLEEFKGIELTVAIGLEIADDRILDRLKKGFHMEDYEKAAKIIHDSDCFVRTYLIVNLPYVRGLKKSLEDSVDYALRHSDSVVLINLLPHEGSELFELWLRGEWNFLDEENFYRLTEKWRDNGRVELDFETFRFFPRFPKSHKRPLVGVGEEYLTHRYYEVWQDYLVRWYKPPEDKDILLFLPCSYKKPYSGSKTHRRITENIKRSKVYEHVHEVMISSPGVIPREFEDMYPFNSYDWDEREENEEIKHRYIEVTAGRIERYLKAHKNNYKRVCCFMKYGSESYIALSEACKRLNIPLKNLLTRETYERVRDSKRPLQTDDAVKDVVSGLDDGNG